MFKILKLFVPKTNVSKLMPSRYVCNQKDSCPQKMTSYDCKQPVEESFCGDLADPVHPFFKCHDADPRPWKNMFFFICLPLIFMKLLDVFYLNKEKVKRPKFIEYSYLRIRTKPFPWHPVKTLFHNPRYNALPTGYEIAVPEDEEYIP